MNLINKETCIEINPQINTNCLYNTDILSISRYDIENERLNKQILQINKEMKKLKWKNGARRRKR